MFLDLSPGDLIESGMARPWLDSDRGDQRFLFPVDPRDLLPKNHLVWGVMKVVDEFDLSQFEAVYHAGGVGRPPYSPRLMVALIVYCYLKGLRSERQIAAACYGVHLSGKRGFVLKPHEP